MKSVAGFLFWAVCLSLLGASSATAWQASIESHPHLPSRFLAVDKTSQTFFVYERKSPLRMVSQFPCTTGQSDGDKQVEDDLRTPEGVYFVQGRLRRELDWELYGNLAYPLDYPNPVDRQKGKTGYGIWIHGRGKQLVPRDTRGCVALKTADLAGIGSEMGPGLPVVISQSLSVSEGGEVEVSVQAARDMDEAVGRVRQWATAWERKSEAFFDFYDAEGFSRAHATSFRRFADRKRGLFERYDWIRVMAEDIRAVPGPDYVVTYFRQYYRTPTIVTEGIKRLYWMRDESGELKIVGREWNRTGRTLDDVYLERSRSEIEPVIDAWRAAWERGDLDGYMAHYAEDAEQGDRRGDAIREHKVELWSVAPPETVELTEPRFAIVPEGIRVTAGQHYAAGNGYEDEGIKTLLLAPRGADWKIIREDWRPL